MTSSDALMVPPTYPGAETWAIDIFPLMEILKDAAIDAGLIVQKWMYAPIMYFPDPITGYDNLIYLRLGHIMLLAFLISMFGFVRRLWWS